MKKATAQKGAVLGLTGVAGYAAYTYTKGAVRFGAPRRASSQVLSGQIRSQRPGTLLVTGGALQYDPSWGEGDQTRVVVGGRSYRIGTASAAMAVYKLAYELGSKVDRLFKAVEDSMSNSQLRALNESLVRTGHYDLSGLSEGQRNLCVALLNASLIYAGGLALLDHMFISVGPHFAVTVVPASLRLRGVGLQHITFGANYLNPMATHYLGRRPAPRTASVQRQGDWTVLGAHIAQTMGNAYQQIAPQQELQGMLDSFDEIETPYRTMGALPAAAVWVIRACLVAALVTGSLAVLISIGARGFSRMMGENVDYIDQLTDSIEHFRDCCVEGGGSPDHPCCQRMEELINRLESYEPPMGFALRTAGLAAIGLAGFWAYRQVSKSRSSSARKLPSGKKKKQLEAEK